MNIVPLLCVGSFLLVLINGSDDAMNSGRRVVCYFGIFSKIHSRSLLPEEIDPLVCTHLIYFNAKVSNLTDEVVPKDERSALYDNGGYGFYNRTAKLKEINPQLKVLLHVFRKSREAEMPTTRSGRSNFIRSAVAILQTHGLDGLDLGWISPGTKEKNNFTLLLSELRAEFDNHGFIITTSFPEYNFSIYDESYLDVIKRCSDFIVVRTLDYWNPTYNTTGLSSALSDVKSSIDFQLGENIPPEKLLIMIPAYGLISNLTDVNDTKIGASSIAYEFKKKNYPFSITVQYRQMLELFKDQSKNWTIYRDEVSNAPYAANEQGQWITYDDVVSVGTKARYVVENKLGGAAIMSLEMDDFRGTGGEGKFPLTRTLSNIIVKGEVNGNRK